MRIGVDARNLAEKRTGIVTYVFDSLAELQKIDDKNIYFLFSHKDFNFPLANKNWHKVIGSGLATKISKVWLQTQLAPLAKRHNLDMFWATANLLPLNLDRNIKTLLTVHDLTYLFYPETMKAKELLAYNLLQKRSILAADKILTVSQATANDIMKNFRIENNKIEAILCGTNLDFFKVQDAEKINQILRKYQLPQNYIIAVSTLEPRKNLSTLLSAYANLLNKYNIPHDLVVIGARGWKDSNIFKQIKELNLSRRVHFMGFVPKEDLPAFYSGAATSVYISLYEGFGSPILEAMACGCPVITSNVSSMPEVAGDAAIPVDCKNIEEISQAILSIINDESARNRLIAKGLSRVKQFNWADRAYQILNAFDRLMNIG